mgnify:CR=1 FL=1|tara:strand:- start:341 stop:625 length:285 start_codon:yes stop_codon:yes gene_type:complete
MATIERSELEEYMSEFYTNGPKFSYIYPTKEHNLKNYEIRISNILMKLCEKKELKKIHLFDDVYRYKLSDKNHIMKFPLDYVKLVCSKVINFFR